MPRETNTPKPATARARKPRAATTTTSPKPRASRKKSVAAPEVLATSNAPDTQTPGEPIVVSSAPSYEEISQAAYQRFIERGGSHGLDFDDWVEAERSLRERG
jgi:hypothetical protein